MNRNEVAGYVITQEMTPLAGEFTPIQPPSYAPNKDGEKFAIEHNPDGTQSVVISSTPAEAKIISSHMLDIFGDEAPGIFVRLQENDEERVRKISDKKFPGLTSFTKDFFFECLWNDLCDMDVSTWTAAHRNSDSEIRYSIDPDTGEQIWSGGCIGDMLRSVSNGMELARNFPNAALLGYWLSARSIKQVKVPRSIQSTIIGYNATECKRGTTKIGSLGAIPSDVKLEAGDRLTISNGKGSRKPSELGLGAIPGSAEVTHYRCENIERKSVVNAMSLKHNLNITEDMFETLLALGIMSVIESADYGVYRSGTSLVTTDMKIEKVTRGNERTLVDVEELYENSLETFNNNKHLFAKPIEAYYSDEIITLIADRMAKSASSKD